MGPPPSCHSTRPRESGTRTSFRRWDILHTKCVHHCHQTSQPKFVGLRVGLQKRNTHLIAFFRAYLRGDFPLVLSHTARGCKLSWKVSWDDCMQCSHECTTLRSPSLWGDNVVLTQVPIETLDFHYYLPLLFDGLRELEHPYVFLSTNGIEDLLAKGGGAKRILPVVPQLIMPMKCE